VSIPNNIAAQIYTNGPQPCANSACRIYVIDWSRAIFLVNQGGAEVWCCWDCLVQSLANVHPDPGSESEDSSAWTCWSDWDTKPAKKRAASRLIQVAIHPFLSG
jgi:hypothetical protein